ncbi:uncharacterized protein A4U43_C06F17170 [Asparagus officinalis]|uniref:Uncharacterized protein n=1 Tax=Asparagus officinalis TaxID=4686 RepID=A0A5P1EPX1_ASPOF|nr:uncharacterized protein A4U43_C06F17170 [Asparagus officinalis]
MGTGGGQVGGALLARDAVRRSCGASSGAYAGDDLGSRQYEEQGVMRRCRRRRRSAAGGDIVTRSERGCCLARDLGTRRVKRTSGGVERTTNGRGAHACEQRPRESERSWGQGSVDRALLQELA